MANHESNAPSKPSLGRRFAKGTLKVLSLGVVPAMVVILSITANIRRAALADTVREGFDYLDLTPNCQALTNQQLASLHAYTEVMDIWGSSVADVRKEIASVVGDSCLPNAVGVPTVPTTP